MKSIIAFLLIYGMMLIGLSVLAQKQIDENQLQVDNISSNIDYLNTDLDKVK